MTRDNVNDPQQLRQLAAWYRQFAERAGNPVIWAARLATAEELEREAVRLEQNPLGPKVRTNSVTKGRPRHSRSAPGWDL